MPGRLGHLTGIRFPQPSRRMVVRTGCHDEVPNEPTGFEFPLKLRHGRILRCAREVWLFLEI